MEKLKKVPATTGSRMNTGPLQIGEDWPGVFIRGDEAMEYAMGLDLLFAKLEQDERFAKEWAGYIPVLGKLVTVLSSCWEEDRSQGGSPNPLRKLREGR